MQRKGALAKGERSGTDWVTNWSWKTRVFVIPVGRPQEGCERLPQPELSPEFAEKFDDMLLNPAC
jgi:hypothetical protein